MDILPSSVALAFARDITSGENTNDIYQIKILNIDFFLVSSGVIFSTTFSS